MPERFSVWFSKKSDIRTPQPPKPPHRRVIDPIAEPDRARLESFLTPGAVSGTIGDYDYDNPNSLGYPTRISKETEDTQ